MGLSLSLRYRIQNTEYRNRDMYEVQKGKLGGIGGRDVIPISPVTCCSISCSFLPLPSHLANQPQLPGAYLSKVTQVAANMARTGGQEHNTIRYSTAMYLTLSCIKYFPSCGVGGWRRAQTERKEFKRKRRTKARTTAVWWFYYCTVMQMVL